LNMIKTEKIKELFEDKEKKADYLFK